MNTHPFAIALRRFWPIIVILIILGAGVGYVASKLSRPAYSSTASVYFGPGYAASAQDLNQGSAYLLSQMPSFVSLATSQSVLAPSIVALGTSRTPNNLAASLQITNPQDSTVIQVTATDGSPRGAARIANVVAGQLSDRVTELTPDLAGRDRARTVTASQITTAPVPRFASSPNTSRNTLAGGVIGLILGGLIASVRMSTSRRVTSRSDVVAATSVDVVGVIARRRGASSGAILVADDMLRLGANVRPYLSGVPSTVLLVTGAAPRSGATTVAAGLARSLGRMGSRVALIDGDTRGGNLAEVAGVDRTPGLVDALRSADVRPTASEVLGVDVLARGDDPGEGPLFPSSEMSKRLEEMRAEYDVVIVDVASTASSADASVLSSLVDGVLVVVDARKDEASTVRASVESLTSAAAPILGVVLNRVSGSHAPRHPSRTAVIERASPADENGVAPAEETSAVSAPTDSDLSVQAAEGDDVDAAPKSKKKVGSDRGR